VTTAISSGFFGEQTENLADIPTAMKKQSQQQALERLDVRFKLVPVFAVGEQAPRRGKRRGPSTDPPGSHASAVPITTSKAAAVNTSEIRVSATIRRSGRRRKRLPMMTATRTAKSLAVTTHAG